MNLILIAWGLNHTAVGPTIDTPNVDPPYAALTASTKPYALFTAHSRPYATITPSS